jgi:DNA-binding response OmpR family regulator
MRILLVEDSCQVGVALKDLLQMFGADVAGPVATTAEAERLISHAPDVALVDVNLRGGEQAYGLIDELHCSRRPHYSDLWLRGSSTGIAEGRSHPRETSQ